MKSNFHSGLLFLKKMNHLKIFLTLFLAISFFSCSHPQNNQHVGIENIKYSTVVIDTIYIAIENSSFSGFSGVIDNSLYFFDEFFSFYYPISIEGNIGKRSLGLGNAPYEIPIRGPLEVCFSNNNSFIVMGGSNDAYIYEQMNNRRRLGMIAHGEKESYESPAAYTIWPEVIMRSYGDHFFYNVIGNNESVDPVTKNDYFKSAHLLMKVDLNSGEMEPVGNYSDYYVTNRNKLKHLPMVYYDIDNKGNFYVTFQADSLIYVYNRKFDLIKCMGYQGKNMDIDYSNPNPDENSFEKAYLHDMQEKGYYYWIKNINELTMRIYQKGAHAHNDGMQIYQGNDLIADIVVPKGFKVIGYVSPYFVTQVICDEDNETMKFYRFKLE